MSDMLVLAVVDEVKQVDALLRSKDDTDAFGIFVDVGFAQTLDDAGLSLALDAKPRGELIALVFRHLFSIQ
jgi:hypothetical protein